MYFSRGAVPIPLWLQVSDKLHVQWTHTYVDVHHSKAKLLTAVEAVETALKSSAQLGMLGELVFSPLYFFFSIKRLSHY